MFGTSAELRSDQSPEIRELGLVDVRADCLASLGMQSFEPDANAVGANPQNYVIG
jgi:hypothetical protein